MKSKHSTHNGAELEFTLLFIFKAQKIHRNKKEMGSRAVLLLVGPSPPKQNILFLLNYKKVSSAPSIRRFTTKATADGSSLEPPDVARLAETARISLTPQQVEAFGPKIRQVIDWFGQIQAVDLDSVEPSIRAGTEGDDLRHDNPETFENREAIIASVPNYEDPYIKVPKVLNKE